MSMQSRDIRGAAEGVTGAVGETLQATADTTKRTIYKAGYGLRDFWLTSANTLQLYMNQYPTLRVFVYSFLALAAIPLGVFATWAGATTLGTLITAAIGTFLVEGGFLALGSTILVPILGICLLISSGVTLGFVATRVAFALARTVGNRVTSLAQPEKMGMGGMTSGMTGGYGQTGYGTSVGGTTGYGSSTSGL